MSAQASLNERARRRAARLIVSFAATLGTAASIGPQIADAHDSLAPAGARHTWLAEEDWIAYHWIPFDEQALKRALGLRGRELQAYLYNDHHTLADLALRRGLDVESLADQLVAPWRGRADEERMALLRDRTLRLLTQGHLAQHVFFHIFHNGGATRLLAQHLNTSTATVHAERARGMTFRQIAHRRGVALGTLTHPLVGSFQYRQRQGVELGVAVRSEAARILARQRAALPCWLRRPHPARDAGNPYGKAIAQHGEHRAGWPVSSRQRSENEARVERVRRSLEPSCWRPPPRWTPTTNEPIATGIAASSPRQQREATRQTVCSLE